MRPSEIVAVAFATIFVASVARAASPPYSCYSFTTTNGTIEPKGDIIRLVGEPYEAYCLFDSTYINVSDVAFIQKERLYEYAIPHTVVNASAIRVEVTHNKSADYDLWCVVKSQHMCARVVNIGYHPQDVKNFTCVSKNYDNLNCTWTVPDNPVKVQYYLTYVIPGFREQSDCPKFNTKRDSCFWPEQTFSLNVKDEWIMQFNATNQLRKEGVLFKHNVSIFESVLPNPVEELAAHVDGPNNVTLTWILPHPIGTLGKILCEAAYRERYDGDVSEDETWKVVDRWIVTPNKWERHELFNKTINNLHAYIQYDFRVRIHTGYGVMRPHMWSDAVSLTMRTSATRPAVAPKTTVGTFEVEETLMYRDIYINWQKVDPLYRAGPNFSYKVVAYDNASNRLIEKNEGEVEIKEAYAKFSNMDKDVTYRFEIIPMNDEGPPEENVKAIVMVPDKNGILKPPTFFKVIAYGGTNKTTYSMRWRLDAEESHKVETVTLFWCKKSKYEERCLNKLEWGIVLEPSSNVTNLTRLDETSLYMFGISVNSQNTSSGIQWITCIAGFGNRPPPLEQFEVSAVTSNKVLLEWLLDCKAKAAEPIGFNISYCIVAEQSQKCPPDVHMWYDSIMDEAALEHEVQNLHPYTNYIFNIAILTHLGLSKWSKSVQVQTKPDKPSGAPQDLTIDQIGQTWTLLSWKPPIESERNGKVVKYRLVWDSSSKRREEKVMANTSSDITHFKVTHLDPYTNYKFEVFACTKIKLTDDACGNLPAKIEHKTKIGAPSSVDNIYQVDEYLKWDHDCTNGPSCFYELSYIVNTTEETYETAADVAAINIRDLNIACTEDKSDLLVKLRAVTYDDARQKLYSPWKEESVTCYLPGIPWWIVLVICAVCIVIVVILIVVGQYGWEKIQIFLKELKRKPALPVGMEDIEPHPHPSINQPFYDVLWPPISRDSISDEKPKSASSALSEEQECQDLIPNGGDRGGRNLSGDSGTSEADPGDSSGCSTGGESDSSSASERVHQSSDSGTVQEEPGFHIDGNKWPGSGSLRLRTPGPPYVRQGLPEGMSGVGYVSAGSVPNLAVGMSDGSMSLQPFTPNLALGTLPEMPLGARTSTGYISMPDADADAISLDVLGNLTLSHDGRQSGFPAYSRHNFPFKKMTPDLSPYTKTGSLPWLNTGYVAVAQAEGGRREAAPQARGYVAVSDAMGVMKRQPSLPSLPSGISKSVSTPDEDLPPGAYCRVGSRNSPGPPVGSSPGYVGITQAMPLHTPNSLTTTSPTNKSPYVTCAIAESLASPSSTPEKGSAGYVSVGDLSGGRWAHPAIQPPDTGEESREVTSAPVESSRGRPSVPSRPSTSDATGNHNRGGSRWPPLAPSLSKQSSGYVSQETLTFHDQVVMSPKRLLAQSHEPHSVVLSANHKASMV